VELSNSVPDRGGVKANGKTEQERTGEKKEVQGSQHKVFLISGPGSAGRKQFLKVSSDQGSFCSQFYPINSVPKEFCFFQSQNLLKCLTQLPSCGVGL